MKKLMILTLAAAAAFSLGACSGSRQTETAAAGGNGEAAEDAGDSLEGDGEEIPETVTVTGVDGASAQTEVTVPYNPQRVVVLDLANLDILDNLGLGDRVVGAPVITLDYLQSYGEDENVANVGTVKTPDLEAVMACEPDLILMGGRMAEYYDSLCEIAPVLRLTTVSDDGLVEAIRANALTIGSIFGETDQVNELLDQYDARIAALAEFAQGKTAVIGMCTTGSFNLLGNDGRCSLIVNEVGFENIGVDAATTGESGDGSGGSTPTHGNEASFELIVSLNPEYIFVMDRDAAIGTSGAQLAQEVMENELVMKTDAYQNGNLIILEHPGIWYLAEGGITSLGIMLEDLESAL